MEVCDRVMNGEYVYPEDTPVIRIGYSNSAEFTSREFDIIRELAQGRKYEEIAADLDTSNTKMATSLVQIRLAIMYLSVKFANAGNRLVLSLEFLDCQ